MISKSSFQQTLTQKGDVVHVRVSLILSGERECTSEFVDAHVAELCHLGMEHIYGEIIQKLSRLSGELPFRVRDAACMSPQQAAEIVSLEISRVLKEIKTEMEMR